MRRSISLAVLLVACLLPVLATPVAAFPLTTCTLALASSDGSGTAIDIAGSGTPDSTVEDPFRVDWDGRVSYAGSTGVVIKNYSYHVEVFGVPTPIRGSDANTDETTDGDGSVRVGSTAPFRVAGLYYVSGGYKGDGGECAGSGWFVLLGSPVGTVPWIAAIVLAVIGLLGILAGLRGHPFTSILGGLLLGVGTSVLLMSHAVMPLAENTPLAAFAGSAVLGLLVGILGRGARGARPGSA